jgi:hypothetical protein
MATDAQSPARPAGRTTAAGLARVRRASLAVLVLLVAEYGIGMYVNLYVTIPRADHRAGLGSAISNGPAVLSITRCDRAAARAGGAGRAGAGRDSPPPWRHRLVGGRPIRACLRLRDRSRLHQQRTALGVHGDVGAHRRWAAVLRGKPLPAAPGQPARPAVMSLVVAAGGTGTLGAACCGPAAGGGLPGAGAEPAHPQRHGPCRACDW